MSESNAANMKQNNLLILEIESMKDELKRKLRKNNKDSIKLDELALENMHLRGDKNQMTKLMEKL